MLNWITPSEIQTVCIYNVYSAVHNDPGTFPVTYILYILNLLSVYFNDYSREYAPSACDSKYRSLV
jgi:hypothetical protein